MRKYVIGVIIGAAITISGQALAETVSNVGKKIQNEYEVYVDGTLLAKEAIVVDGTSYTPNRVLADAVGYDVAFEKNTVFLTKKEETSVTSEAAAGEESQTDPAVVSKIDPSTVTLENVDRLITEMISSIQSVEYSIKIYEEKGFTAEVAAYKKRLEQRKADLAKLREIKAQLKAQQ